VQRFVAENLSELVSALDADGEVAAAKLNEHAEALVSAYRERERIAGEISALAALVAPVNPGDVSYSRAEQVVRAATALVEAGGEAPPVLRHDPRQPRHGQLAEAPA
jgi:hypothetical protein